MVGSSFCSHHYHQLQIQMKVGKGFLIEVCFKGNLISSKTFLKERIKAIEKRDANNWPTMSAFFYNFYDSCFICCLLEAE